MLHCIGRVRQNRAELLSKGSSVSDARLNRSPAEYCYNRSSVSVRSFAGAGHYRQLIWTDSSRARTHARNNRMQRGRRQQTHALRPSDHEERMNV